MSIVCVLHQTDELPCDSIQRLAVCDQLAYPTLAWYSDPMLKHWISNTIFLHGFANSAELYAFLRAANDFPRDESNIHLPENILIDLDYFTINISNIQNKLRLSISFLTDANIAKDHVSWIFPPDFEQLKMTYAVIDTRTDAVELYNFAGREVTNHKSVPRGLGRPLLDELESLPDRDKNISLTLQEYDVLELAEFQEMVAKIFSEI